MRIRSRKHFTEHLCNNRLIRTICCIYPKTINSSTPRSDQDRIFSLQYQYNVKKTSDKNKRKKKHQLGKY